MSDPDPVVSLAVRQKHTIRFNLSNCEVRMVRACGIRYSSIELVNWRISFGPIDKIYYC